MIELIFTIDYEIFGNGSGSLARHVFEPTQRLLEIFQRHQAKMVFFVEPLEFQKIEAFGTDTGSEQVRGQIKDIFDRGFEIALHLHPQWHKAVPSSTGWSLDYDEYNLCRLPETRIEEIVGDGIDYLRQTLNDSDFSPVSFRAGNWLFQPTEVAARVLAGHGVRLDSSAFRGGLQRGAGLDYRRVPAGRYHWRFSRDVCVPEADGLMVEVPIHTALVPAWKMVTAKRVKTHRSGASSSRTLAQRFLRACDLARPYYPQKLDFCRMTIREMTTMMDEVLGADGLTPSQYKPIVAIGHSKDLTDFEAVEAFLKYLKSKNIATADFRDVLRRLDARGLARPEAAVQC